jgi:hypothetical protein
MTDQEQKFTPPIAPDRMDFGTYPDLETHVEKDPLKGSFAKSMEAANSLQCKAEDLAKNEDLSDKGRQKEMGKAAAETLKAVEEAETPITVAEQELQRLQAEVLEAAENYTPDMAEQMRAIEHRGALIRLDGEKRLEVIIRAINAGDVDTMRAVVSAPAYVTGIQPTLHERCKNALLVATHGEQISEIQSNVEKVRAARKANQAARNYAMKSAPNDALIAAGVTGPFRSKMTLSQKTAFIDAYGAEAYLALPD